MNVEDRWPTARAWVLYEDGEKVASFVTSEEHRQSVRYNPAHEPNGGEKANE